jgi:hypothetical protein
MRTPEVEANIFLKICTDLEIVNHFCLGTSFVDFNTVAYLLKARTVEPEKPPLITNGSKQHPFLGNG